ncbi:mucin-like protein isoform X2 [Dysidea avara]
MPSSAVLPFLSFADGKKQLRRYLDGVSDTIYIPNGFPFGLQTHTLAYVSTNGVISFSRPFYYWWPFPFPGFYYLRRFHVVAPYWSDNDIRREGEVSYEIFEKGRSSYDDVLLDRVNTYLTANMMTNFSGTFMILAEWRDVHPYPHGSSYFYYFQIYYPTIRSFTNQMNTYQAVVITDGSESYAVFTYMCDLMKWSGLYNNPTIGFNAAGTFFANHPLTANRDANQIDCTGEHQYNNVMYKISADPDLIEQQRRKCLSWYFSDIESYGSSESMTEFSKGQIACPCSWRQARWERRYWFFTIKDDSFCYIERFRNALGGAQECCYSRSSTSFGALVLQGRSSGGLLRYHPYWSWIINYPNYILYDRNAQDTCCLSEVGFCKFYHERRPPNDCTGYVPQRRAWAGGDPHITTLDGRRYTFNGWGEYVLLRTTSSDFKFQGRTQPPANSTATIFSAFVLQEANDVVEVSIDTSGESFAVIFNSVDMSDNLTSVGDNITSSSAFVEKSSNNSIAVSFPSGVGITINVTAGLLVYTLEVPPSLEGTTSGLLGNYNGNNSDEFVFRNGTMISNSSPDAVIHQFGQSWQVTGAESLFTYTLGENVDTYSVPDHIPPFLDEILSSLMGNSSLLDVCGDNVECLFDFNQTGDPNVGMAAMIVENQIATEMNDASSFPPNITAPEIFLATVGEDSVYTFTVTSDSDNINVMVLHDGEDMLPDSVMMNDLDGDSYSITWTADNSTVLNLTIVANDPSKENISSLFIPTVHLCACENGGNCTTSGLLNIDTTFVVLNCECPAGYDGEYCQNDADGCDIISCLEGQQCFDYPAPLVGAECSCPSGYAAGNDSKCVDIDECANSSSNVCTQQCVNTPGSYQCDCYDGYQPVDVNATQCEDIDECMEYNDCHQICTNTNGSYECSCNPGFMLMNDNRTCTAITECNVDNPCQEECAIVDLIETCFCPPHYEVDPSNSTTCRDIDECGMDGACDQTCTNTDGSFVCSCDSGYALDGNGRDCNDIDECLAVVCPTNMICINTVGGYNCSCPQGTIRNGSNCDLEVLVPPPRLVITPSTITTVSVSSPTNSPSVTPTLNVIPTPIEKSDDTELSVGALVGIIFGGIIVIIIVVCLATLLIYVVKVRILSAKKISKVLPANESLVIHNTKAAELQMDIISIDENE